MIYIPMYALLLKSQ